METQLANTSVDVNEEGYLTNFAQWTPAVAEAIANSLNITLTPRHWDVSGYKRILSVISKCSFKSRYKNCRHT